jgi:hypothetical protein
MKNLAKLSSPIIAGVLFAEIVALLIAPIAYFALFPPPANYGLDQTFPLTNSQIAASWPNLPTANQVASIPHGFVLAETFPNVKNQTVVNIPNLLHGGLVPVEYNIWLEYNDTWIQIPYDLLATNNPPPIPSQHSGFLGTGLPVAYVGIAVAAIAASAGVGVSYLLMAKRRRAEI